MKRVFCVVCCIAVLFSVLAFSGCSAENGAEKAFKAFMDAHENGDISAIVKLTPPAFYDYLIDLGTEYGYDREGIENFVERSVKPTLFLMDFGSMLGDDFSFKDEFSFDYKITDTYKASSSEVKKFNSYVKNELDFDIGADSIVLLEAVFSVDSKNNVFKSNGMIERGICLEVNGKWYYLSNSARKVPSLYGSVYEFDPEHGVEWMYNWLYDLG